MIKKYYPQNIFLLYLYLDESCFALLYSKMLYKAYS